MAPRSILAGAARIGRAFTVELRRAHGDVEDPKIRRSEGGSGLCVAGGTALRAVERRPTAADGRRPAVVEMLTENCLRFFAPSIL